MDAQTPSLAWIVFSYVVVAFSGAAIAYGVKFYYDKKLERKKTQAHIVCSPSCHPFLNADASQTGHTVELLVDGERTHNAALFYYRLKNSSQIIARNVKVRIELQNDVKLLRYTFLVQQQVVCERLETDERSTPPKFKWSYINPGEVIDLELVIVPYLGTSDVKLEVDGEYVLFEEKPIQTNCAIPNQQ